MLRTLRLVPLIVLVDVDLTTTHVKVISTDYGVLCIPR